MLMKPEPFFRILKELTERADRRPLIVYPSPQGKTFRQKNAIALARENHLIFLCGHYKGIDQRVVERWVDIEYSLGDYVITGGEPAVLVMIDAATRMIPGVLGDFDSARGDSFYDGVLDSPHYTRPESLDGRKVPELLASGHHKNIGIWRRAMGEFITSKRRPDLIHKIKAKPLTKTDADRKRKV